MSDNEDLKAKMREALDRKKPHDDVSHPDHHDDRPGHESGPQHAVQQHRRKAGGGGS